MIYKLMNEINQRINALMIQAANNCKKMSMKITLKLSNWSLKNSLNSSKLILSIIVFTIIYHEFCL